MQMKVCWLQQNYSVKLVLQDICFVWMASVELVSMTVPKILHVPQRNLFSVAMVSARLLVKHALKLTKRFTLIFRLAGVKGFYYVSQIFGVVLRLNICARLYLPAHLVS